jgi:hypothetical protein
MICGVTGDFPTEGMELTHLLLEISEARSAA